MMIKRFLMILAIVFLSASSWAAQVTLTWDAPEPPAEPIGYRIYQGVASGVYDKHVDAGTQMVWTSVAAPAGTGTITVSASVNTKTSPADVKRYVTLRATYDTTSKVVNEFDYNIVDMVGI